MVTSSIRFHTAKVAGSFCWSFTRVWRALVNASVAPATCSSNSATALGPSPNRLAAASPNEQQILLWDCETRKPLRPLSGHERGVGALAMGPDGERLLSVGLDGEVLLWELQRLSRHLRFRDVSGRPLGAAAYLPDGGQVLVGSDDGNARLYRVGTADLVAAACGLALPALRTVCNDFISRRKMTPPSPTSHR